MAQEDERIEDTAPADERVTPTEIERALGAVQSHEIFRPYGPLPKPAMLSAIAFIERCVVPQRCDHEAVSECVRCNAVAVARWLHTAIEHIEATAVRQASGWLCPSTPSARRVLGQRSDFLGTPEEKTIEEKEHANRWAVAIRDAEEKAAHFARQRSVLLRAIRLMKKQLRDGAPWPDTAEAEIIGQTKD